MVRRAWRSLLLVSAAAGALAAGAARAEPVLPTGGAVRAGDVAIGAPAGGALTIAQTSARGIVDWTGFAIGAGGTVRFDNGTGATLNRVTGGAVSTIDGLLSASGSVYLVNPNGVIVGASGVVDVGGSFVAATLAPDAARFMAGGDLPFASNGTGAVVNLGRIGALGGDVALIAARVENRGSIAAPAGTVGLLAGTAVLLRDATLDDGRFLVRLGGAHTSATNAGTIAAAAAELRANGGNVYALAGDTAGVIRATGVASGEGRVFLTAGDAGTVAVAGSIVARGADGTPGQVETSGGTVTIGAAAIDAGVGGGWLVDPNDLAIDQTAATSIAASLNAGTSVTQATTAAGSGGVGDITLAPGVTIAWRTNAGLTLSAYRTIAFGAGATIAASGAAPVTLTADNSGTGTGTVSFASGARVATAGTVTILYDPASNPAGSGINQASYTAPTDFSANVGGGAALTAYMLVNTAADLQNVRNNLSGSYTLGRDIDAGAIAAFAPIGSSAAPFGGILGGQYHSIANLAVAGTGDDAGLFGVIGAGGTVREVVLLGGSVAGGRNVGALAGRNLGSVLYSSASAGVSGAVNVGGLVGANAGLVQAVQGSGTVTGSDTVGGLVGDNGGTLANSLATGAVTGGSKLGGVAGRNGGTMIADVARGAVTASGDFAGGLLGANDAPGIVSNALATGAVAGGNHVGGLVGFVAGGSVANSRAEGDVAARGTNSGGLIGYNNGAVGNDAATGRVTSGSDVTGGLIGYSDAAGSIRNASAGGSVAGGSFVGGLVGYNAGAVNGAAAGGDVRAAGDDAGGLIGANAGSVLNSNAGGAVAGGYYVGGLVGASLAGATLAASSASGAANGANFVGGLVGLNAGSVGGASASGAVAATGIAAGGLIGSNYGTVGRAWATGAVSAREAAGGLIGANRGSLTDVYAQGAVTATADAASGQGAFGGLLGYNSATVVRAYATGAVTGPHDVGGLVGVNDTGRISSTYATGRVTGGDTHTGGLVGGNGGFLVASYWDVVTTGQAAAAGLNLVTVDATALGGASAPSAYAQASYGAFDFGSGWVILEGSTRPFLAAEYATTITNAHQLQLVTTRPNTSYVLAGDIDLAELNDPAGLWNTATGFVPIGATSAASFRGVFEGGGHTLSGLRINRPDTSYVGLFGYSSGTIRNLNLAGGSVAGNAYVGALIGDALAGTIANVTSSVAVNGKVVPETAGVRPFTYVGGLAGDATAAISNVSTSGDVVGGTGVGGLVGVLEAGGSISGAHATGAVTGSSTVGGLVGQNAGTLTDVYATGAVRGVITSSTAAMSDGSIGGSVGGLVGSNHSAAYDAFNGGNASFAPRITNAFATGAVTGNGTVGGLIGENDGIVTTVYATGAVEGRDSIGGLVGYNAGGLTNAYATGAVTGHHTNVGGLIGYEINFGRNTVGALYSSGAVNYVPDPGSTVADDQKAVGGFNGTGLSSASSAYWDVGTSGQTSGSGRFGGGAVGIGGTTGRDPRQQATYQGFDFATVWRIDPGTSRPYLRAVPQAPAPQ